MDKNESKVIAELGVDSKEFSWLWQLVYERNYSDFKFTLRITLADDITKSHYYIGGQTESLECNSKNCESEISQSIERLFYFVARKLQIVMEDNGILYLKWPETRKKGWHEYEPSQEEIDRYASTRGV